MYLVIIFDVVPLKQQILEWSQVQHINSIINACTRSHEWVDIKVIGLCAAKSGAIFTILSNEWYAMVRSSNGFRFRLYPSCCSLHVDIHVSTGMNSEILIANVDIDVVRVYFLSHKNLAALWVEVFHFVFLISFRKVETRSVFRTFWIYVISNERMKSIKCSIWLKCLQAQRWMCA